MNEAEAVVACYHCQTKNIIFLGADFYKAEAFYRCYSCNKASHVILVQKNLDVLNNDITNIQTGKKFYD